LLGVTGDRNGSEEAGREAEAGDTIELMWSRMRALSNIIFVILFLVAIFGQTSGLIESYTFKKMMPRILAAALLTQLSYFITVELSDSVANIGFGLQSFLEGELDIEKNSLIGLLFDSYEGVLGPDTIAGAGVVSVMLALATVGTGAIVPAFLLALPFIFAMVISVIVGLITMIARKMILIVLVVISPLALVFWILPSTEKNAKKWFDLYIKSLLMHPLIILLIVVGKIVAKILFEVGDSSTSISSTSVVFLLAGVTAYILPYAMLPMTFKMSGSAISAANGFLKSQGDKLSQQTKKWSDGKWGNQKKQLGEQYHDRVAEGKDGRINNWKKFGLGVVSGERAKENPTLGLGSRSKEYNERALDRNRRTAQNEAKNLELENLEASRQRDRQRHEDDINNEKRTAYVDYQALVGEDNAVSLDEFENFGEKDLREEMASKGVSAADIDSMVEANESSFDGIDDRMGRDRIRQMQGSVWNHDTKGWDENKATIAQRRAAAADAVTMYGTQTQIGEAFADLSQMRERGYKGIDGDRVTGRHGDEIFTGTTKALST